MHRSGGETEQRTRALTQFCSEAGETAGPPIELPLNLPKQKLQLILNSLLKQDDNIPYSFFVEEKEVTKDLNEVLPEDYSEEKIVSILYQAQAVFKVQAVTRCTSSLPGHAEAVLCASFSPDGRFLASGSGDTTVRFWDISTETPHWTAKGHKHWVLVTAWSPDGNFLASGCKSGLVIVWDPNTGKQVGRTFNSHTKWITALCWEPLHLSEDGRCCRLASASKDGTIRIWNTTSGSAGKALSGHMQSVTALRWSGEGFIYSASQDRTIKVWRPSDGVLCRTLQGHGHWVNTLALNTDYAIRTGASDPKKLMKTIPEYIKNPSDRKTAAEERYRAALQQAGGVEKMVSGSDDFTLYLWTPTSNKRPVAHMTGHQQLVNDVKFSPDTRLIASASFDKSIRLWNALDGKFIAVLRGHVSGVYQLAWSADSRLLVSGSKDSTLKVWSVEKRNLLLDLPGHADEVYTVDWSPDGQRVVSGGKDKILKLWRK
uniref:Notchless protein homolog 1-like n=1 Tax=Hirondellea gigas TaxID=1518452 RepID=A0A6A7FTF7_9CRUS